MMASTNSARKALEARAASTPAALAGDAPATVSAMVRGSIDRASEAFGDVLPATVDADRFARLVLTAVRSTPTLLECFATPEGEQSVLFAAMQAAIMGLEPNTPAGDCWITPRRRGQVAEATLTLGYRGKRKLMRRAGNVATVFAEVVREGDTFSWVRGFDRDELVHELDPAGPVTDLLWVYAVVRYTDGGHDAVRLHRTEVEAHRALSDSYKSARPYSPWTLHTVSMWKKTAIHELAKVVDLEPALVRLLDLDDRAVTLDASTGELIADDGPVDAEVVQADEIEAPARVSIEPADTRTDAGAGAEVDARLADLDARGVAVPAAAGDERAAVTAEQITELRRLLRVKRGASGPQVPKVLTSMLGRKVSATTDLDGDDVSSLLVELRAEADHELEPRS